MSHHTSLRQTVRNYATPLLVLAIGVGGYFGLRSLHTPPVADPPDKKAPLVDVEPIAQHTGGITLDVNGEVTAYRVVALSAEVAGRIVTKAPECRTGRYVSQGLVLFQIDPRDYELDVQRLGQMVDQAQAMIDELEVEHSNAESLIQLAEEDLRLQRNELKRVESLARRNIASDSEVDASRRSELVARNTLQTTQNRLRLLSARRIRLQSDKSRTEVDWERAKLDLARTTIRCPVDGVVMEQTVEKNAYVGKGTMLVRIEDTSKAEIRFNLRLDQLRWLWSTSQEAVASVQGQSYALPRVPITVALDVRGQAFHWKGHLARYDGASIDPATRTVPCIAVVDDPRAATFASTQPDPSTAEPRSTASPPALLRGMFVTLRVHIPFGSPLLAVPASALKPGDRLWIAQSDHLLIRKVQVVHATGATALVRADPPAVEAGSRVIISPLALAIDGMPIRIRPQGDSAEPPSSPEDTSTAEAAP